MSDDDPLSEPKKQLADVSKWLATLATTVIGWLVINAKPNELLWGTFPEDSILFLCLLTIFASLGASVLYGIAFRISCADRNTVNYPFFKKQRLFIALGSAVVIFLPLTEKGKEQLTVKIDTSGIPKGITMAFSQPDLEKLKGPLVVDVTNLRKTLVEEKINIDTASLKANTIGVNISPIAPIPIDTTKLTGLLQNEKIRINAADLKEVRLAKPDFQLKIENGSVTVKDIETLGKSLTSMGTSLKNIDIAVKKLDPDRRARGQLEGR